MLQNDFEFVVDADPQPEASNVIGRGIHEHLVSIFGEVQEGRLLVLAKSDGETVGGASGSWGSFGWLYVGGLWVNEKIRGRGLGSRLLAMIETEGIRRGCKNVYLDTMTFQAPDFYKRLGHSVFGELEDFPTGHSRVFFRKKLAE